MLKTLLTIALVALFAFVALAVLLTTMQGRMLYQPTRADGDAWALPGTTSWPSGEDLRGLLATPEATRSADATVVVFHGNAGHAGHRLHHLPPFLTRGMRVILAEYPGYGPRAGNPAQPVLIDDAAATLVQAHQRFGAPVLVMGVSLGAAVAAAAAAREPASVSALLLITPWRRLADVAEHHYPWLPVGWLLRETWDSAIALQGFTRPVVVVVAADDDIVPAASGRALFDALVGPRHFERIAGAGHNDWSVRVDAAWWTRVLTAAGMQRTQP